jgi:shikimate kinase
VDHHVVLIGLMGAGKTSIGRLVASGLGLPLIDGDEVLAERTGGKTASEIVEEQGFDRLHELEATIAVEALDAADPAVIGPAASVCESSTVRDAMAAHTVVWLAASPELLAEKAPQETHRPLPDDTDLVGYFRQQLAVREPLIAALHPLVVDVEAQDDQAAASVIIDAVARAAG